MRSSFTSTVFVPHCGLNGHSTIMFTATYWPLVVVVLRTSAHVAVV